MVYGTIDLQKMVTMQGDLLFAGFHVGILLQQWDACSSYCAMAEPRGFV